jgi:hypothetical protein
VIHNNLNSGGSVKMVYNFQYESPNQSPWWRNFNFKTSCLLDNPITLLSLFIMCDIANNIIIHMFIEKSSKRV